MTPDEHQRERMRAWAHVAAHTDTDWIENADYMLAAFDKRFPAPTSQSATPPPPAAQAASREIEALRAENERLRAACAAKDEAICTLRDHITVGMYRAVPHLAEVAASALSDDAGKGWVSTEGAVESEIAATVTGARLYSVVAPVPADWIGKRVWIILKPEDKP